MTPDDKTISPDTQSELYGDDYDDASPDIEFREKADDSGESDFYNNLAEDMEDSELRSIAAEFIELIERDKDAKKKRDEQYKKGLERTGAGVEAPGGAEFDGASKATHPVLLECCIDFSASAIKEMFPADGPCRIKVFNDEAIGDDFERADRVRQYMNYQLTTEIEEYEETLDEILSQVPLGGSQYMKFWWDSGRDRPRVEPVWQDDMFLPFAESSFWNAKRKTVRMYLSRAVIEERIRNGLYRDIVLSGDPQTPDFDEAAKAAHRIEGIDSDGYNEDGLREVYEIYAEYQLKADDRPYPYIITVDHEDQNVWSVYRNWEEKDDTCKAMDWIVEFPFVKWRGAYSLGFAHIIGGLTAAVTGALRALLDSAHINNAATMLKLKGGRVTGQSETISIGGVTEIVGAAGIDDIRKIAMPVPFNPPSPMLFQLLGFLTDAAKGIVAVAEEKLADATANAPVGTTLALIEQGSKVFSAIHKRLHRAQKKSLSILYRLNRMYLTNERIVEELGQMAVHPADFEGPCWIIPVSDPNIFSEAQRVAQIQAVMQLASTAPQMYDLRAIQKRALQLLRVPDYESLLVKQSEPEELNPVAENLKMAMGQGATAYPLQDHAAHIQTHLMFLQDPVFGANPIISQGLLAPMVEHLKQHLIMAYARMMYDAGSAAARQPLDALMKDKDAKTRAAFDQLMAATAIHVQKASGPAFSAAVKPMIEAFQQLQKQQMPQPMDPSAVAMADVNRQTQKDQTDAELKKAQMQQDGQLKGADLQQKQQTAAQSANNQQQKNMLMAQQQQTQAALDQRKQDLADQEASVRALAEHDRTQQQREAQQDTAVIEGAKIQQSQTQHEQTEENKAAMNTEDNETALEIADKRSKDIRTGKSLTNPNP